MRLNGGEGQSTQGGLSPPTPAGLDHGGLRRPPHPPGIFAGKKKRRSAVIQVWDGLGFGSVQHG